MSLPFFLLLKIVLIVCLKDYTDGNGYERYTDPAGKVMEQQGHPSGYN